MGQDKLASPPSAGGDQGVTYTPVIQGGKIVWDWVVGGLLLSGSRLATAPLVRAKLDLQTQGTSGSAIESLRKLSGTGPDGRATHRNLFRGGVAGIVKFLPTEAYTLALIDILGNAVRPRIPEGTGVGGQCAASIAICALAGGTAQLAAYPLDLVYTKLAADRSQPPQHKSWLKCIGTVGQSQGMLGLYKGVSISVAGMAVHRGLQYGLYRGLVGWCKDGKDGGAEWTTKVPISVGCATLATVVSNPFDTVRHRLMVNVGTPEAFASLSEAWSSTVAGGSSKLFRGVGPGVVRSALLVLAADFAGLCCA